MKQKLKLPSKSEERGRLYDLLQLDDEACARLQRMCEDLGVTIVLSSTWRLSGLGHTVPLLKERGFTYEIRRLTPNLGPDHASGYTRSDTQRGLEIEWWILTNVPYNERGDLRICILDDDSDMGRLMPWLVQTTWKEGLQDLHLDRLREALTKPLGPLLDDLNPLWTDRAVEYLQIKGAIR